MKHVMPSYKVVILAGESSGDYLGAKLMKALRSIDPMVSFYGAGGSKMEKEGLASWYNIKKLSVLGFFMGPLRIRYFWRVIKKTERLLEDLEPHILITIDFPGLHFFLGKRLQKKGRSFTHVHYVAPTVWAWRPKRAQKIAHFLDGLLALFPFEPSYFPSSKLRTYFVGHPLLEDFLSVPSIEEASKTLKIDQRSKIVTLLPGSRFSEIQKLLPLFLRVAVNLHTKYPDLKIFIPTLPSTENIVQEIIEPFKKNKKISLYTITDWATRKCLYRISDLAIAASGTVSLELACAGVPMVITYKVAAFNAFILRRLIKIPYACLINILAKRFIVPELLQERCTVEEITKTATELLESPDKRKQQQDAFLEVKSLLWPDSHHTLPSVCAANKIYSFLKNVSE